MIRAEKPVTPSACRSALVTISEVTSRASATTTFASVSSVSPPNSSVSSRVTASRASAALRGTRRGTAAA